MISKDNAGDGEEVDIVLEKARDKAVLSIYLKFDSMKI